MMKKTHLMAQKYKRGFNQAAGRRQRWQRAGRPESTERTWTRSKSFAHRSEDVFREDEVLLLSFALLWVKARQSHQTGGEFLTSM